MDGYTPDRPLQVALAIRKSIERQGVRRAVEIEDGLEVVAEVSEARTVATAVATTRPDVVVLDCDLGVGLEESLALAAPLGQRTAVLAFGPLDETCIVSMIAAGVNGYLYHGEDLTRVGEAVRACGRGEVWYSPAVVPLLAQGRPGWLRHHWPRPTEVAADDPALTRRQWDVLRLVASGQANKEIARALAIQRSTVEEHLTQVYAKLGVSGRPEAVRWYVEREMRGRRGAP